MLTKFLADSFVGLIELLMWLVVIFGTLAAIGSDMTGYAVADAGLGFIFSLFVAAIFFGPIIMIVELKKSVSRIESILSNRN
tara:strand:- start:348 stop:593 length:246 start_codon:yes stop_codon:yes gene_type:complete